MMVGSALMFGFMRQRKLLPYHLVRASCNHLLVGQACLHCLWSRGSGSSHAEFVQTLQPG